MSELALKKLSTADDRSKWIARDQETRRVWREAITASETDLFLQRLLDTDTDRIRSLGDIAFLSAHCRAADQHENWHQCGNRLSKKGHYRLRSDQKRPHRTNSISEFVKSAAA